MDVTWRRRWNLLEISLGAVALFGKTCDMWDFKHRIIQMRPSFFFSSFLCFFLSFLEAVFIHCGHCASLFASLHRACLPVGAHFNAPPMRHLAGLAASHGALQLQRSPRSHGVAWRESTRGVSGALHAAGHWCSSIESRNVNLQPATKPFRGDGAES